MKKVLGVTLGVTALLTTALPSFSTQVAGQEVSTSATATYVRWVITEARGGVGLIQAAEIIFYNGGVPLANTGNDSPDGSIIVTNPGGYSDPNYDEGPTRAYDGSDSTKWLDFNFPSSQGSPTGQSILVIQFPAPVTFDSYSWVTGNDVPERDPISWRLEVSSDGMTWTTIDTRSVVSVSDVRGAIVGPFTVSGGGSGKDFGSGKSGVATSGPRANRDIVLSLEPPRTRGYIK